MNTSALPQQAGLLPEPQAAFSGTLLHNAQARTRQLDHDGHVVPVLCMDVELDTALRNHLHVEQPFAIGAHQACEARARTLRAGMRVTIDVPFIGLAIVARNVSHVHVHNPEKESTPA